MESKTILIGVLIGIIVGGALVYTVTPRYDPTAYHSQIEELESSLSGLEEQNSDLQTQLSALQAQISSLQTSLGAKDTEINSLGAEVETLTTENAALSTENAALTELLHSSEGTDGSAILPTYDKMELWDLTTGPHLRGACIWQRRVYLELDGHSFMGSNPVGPPFYQEDFDRLASFGANLVVISHPGLFTIKPPYTLDKAVQNNLDRLLEMIAEADMFAVIAFRHGPGRSEWAFYEPDEVFSYLKDISMWENQEAQDAWAEMWRYTAERYKDNPIVAGYQLMVEPNSNEEEDMWDPEEFHQTYEGSLLDWNQLYPRITTAIREVDTETPILIGGNAFSAVGWLPYVEPIDDQRTVYLVHQYELFWYTHQWYPFEITYPGTFLGWSGVYEDFDRGWLENLFEPIGEFIDTHGVSVAAGEFGVARYQPGAAEFLDDEMDLFEQYGMNHVIWNWSPSWEPHAYNDDFNYLHGPDLLSDQRHLQGEVLPNDMVDAIQKYWGYNTVRPSDLG